MSHVFDTSSSTRSDRSNNSVIARSSTTKNHPHRHQHPPPLTMTTTTTTTTTKTTQERVLELGRRDPLKQTEDLCNLFSSTLQSLAADATAVKQITSLTEWSGILSSSSLSKTGNKNKNKDDDVDDLEEKELLLQKLHDVDELVTTLEEKVLALRQIVMEEKRALQMFESTLDRDAKEQEALAQKLVQAFESVGVFQDKKTMTQTNPSTSTTLKNNNTINNNNNNNNNNINPKSRHRRDSVDPRSSTSSDPRDHHNHSHNPTHPHHEEENRDPTNHKHNNHNNNNNSNETMTLSMERVTAQELRERKASNNPPILGRISLITLNEAMEEIEQVCQQKWEHLHYNNNTYSNNGGGAHGSIYYSANALQRRQDFLRRRQQHHGDLDMQVEAHVGQWWVSEQELREQCAFFRNGESTARATLSILCSLRRLKQVPGKNREVTYICINRNNNSNANEEHSLQGD